MKRNLNALRIWIVGSCRGLYRNSHLMFLSAKFSSRTLICRNSTVKNRLYHVWLHWSTRGYDILCTSCNLTKPAVGSIQKSDGYIGYEPHAARIEPAWTCVEIDNDIYQYKSIAIEIRIVLQNVKITTWAVYLGFSTGWMCGRVIFAAQMAANFHPPISVFYRSNAFDMIRDENE